MEAEDGGGGGRGGGGGGQEYEGKICVVSAGKTKSGVSVDDAHKTEDAVALHNAPVAARETKDGIAVGDVREKERDVDLDNEISEVSAVKTTNDVSMDDEHKTEDALALNNAPVAAGETNDNIGAEEVSDKEHDVELGEEVSEVGAAKTKDIVIVDDARKTMDGVALDNVLAANSAGKMVNDHVAVDDDEHVRNSLGRADIKRGVLLHGVEELAASAGIQDLLLHLVSKSMCKMMSVDNDNVSMDTNSWGAGLSNGESASEEKLMNIREHLLQTEKKLEMRERQLHQSEELNIKEKLQCEEKLSRKEKKLLQREEDVDWKEREMKYMEENLNVRESKLATKEGELKRIEDNLNIRKIKLDRKERKFDTKESELKRVEENLKVNEKELNKRERESEANLYNIQTNYYTAKLCRLIGMDNLRKLIGKDEGSDIVLPLVAPTEEEEWNRRHVLYDAVFMLFLPLIFCLQSVFTAMDPQPSHTTQAIIFYICGYIWMCACFGGLLGLFSKGPNCQIASTHIGRAVFLAFCTMQVVALWFLVPSKSVLSKIVEGVLCGCVILSHIGCWCKDWKERRESR